MPFQGRLTHEAFAELETFLEVVASRFGVTG